MCNSPSSLNLLIEKAGVSFGLITEMLMSLGGPGWLNVISGCKSPCVCMCTREKGVCVCVCVYAPVFLCCSGNLTAFLSSLL